MPNLKERSGGEMKILAKCDSFEQSEVAPEFDRVWEMGGVRGLGGPGGGGDRGVVIRVDE